MHAAAWYAGGFDTVWKAVNDLGQACLAEAGRTAPQPGRWGASTAVKDSVIPVPLTDRKACRLHQHNALTLAGKLALHMGKVLPA
jgi:hypothetical protein